MMSLTRPYPIWLTLLVAVLLVLLSAGVRVIFLGPLGLSAPFIQFYFAVIISGYFGGLPAGLLATALSTFIGAHYWMEPVGRFGIEKPADWMLLGVFLTSAGPMSFVFELAHRAQRRVVEANRQLREANQKLGELDQAKTAFFSNISHEFRTPLALILAPLEESLAEGEMSIPQRQRVEIAHRNSLRLLKLVNALLDFSRIEAGRMRAVYEAIDLAGLTTDLASNFRSATERAGLTLRINCLPLPKPVYVDRDMWEKILLNLLSNAFKFTFQGEIAVELKPRDETVELTVRDTGVGIPAKELSHVFERFYRVKGVDGRTHEGSGIGLALVRELVGLHGGTIRVESILGKGSVFIVSMPSGKAHLPADQIEVPRTLSPTESGAGPFVEEAMRWLPAEVAETANVSPEETTPSAPMTEQAAQERSAKETTGEAHARIVWADDNADMREYVKRLLGERYDVEAVDNGEKALVAARRLPPALVLTDVMMPKLDGFGLLRELRADEQLRTVPVILLSARAGEEARIDGLTSGADDYLVKPFSARELLARVESTLRMAAMRREVVRQEEALAAMRQIRDELEGLVEERTRELQDANQELEAFSYSVSHDLRAPLQTISAFSRFLFDDYGDKLDKEGSHYLERLRAATQHMDQLIDDILKLSRLSRTQMTTETVNLGELAQEVVNDLRERDPKRTVTTSIEPDLLVRGDKGLLKAMLENLIGNAWKFTEKVPTATIEFSSDRSEDGTTYFIRDNGAGFDMRFAGKLFTPFSRLHSQSEFSGTGIGLAHVQRIVRRHGGRIWAESEPGKGAVFHFSLPK